MSRAIVEETRDPDFMQAVQAVVDVGLPIHLIAGERSAAAWDVPDFVRRAAHSYTEQPDAGHLMMLEAPDAFCRIVDECLHTRGGLDGPCSRVTSALPRVVTPKCAALSVLQSSAFAAANQRFAVRSLCQRVSETIH